MGVQILAVLLCFEAGILTLMAQLLIPAGLWSGILSYLISSYAEVRNQNVKR